MICSGVVFPLSVALTVQVPASGTVRTQTPSTETPVTLFPPFVAVTTDPLATDITRESSIPPPTISLVNNHIKLSFLRCCQTRKENVGVRSVSDGRMIVGRTPAACVAPVESIVCAPVSETPFTYPETP